MKKKYFLIALAIIVLALGGFLIWRRGKTTEVIPSEPEGTLIETPLEDRPYITLTPRADGKEFTLDISRIKMPRQSNTNWFILPTVFLGA